MLAFFAITVALSGALPLWLDEILQLQITGHGSAGTLISHLPDTSGAVPLGYLAQWESLRLTGYSVRLARLPSAFFVTAAVFVVGLLGGEFGLRRRWMGAGIFALFPLTVRYACESRVYALGLFLSVLATFIYVRFAKRPGIWLLFTYCTTLILAIYTQPYAAFVAPAHILWSAFNRQWKCVVQGSVAFAAAVTAFLPWYIWSKSRWVSGITTTGLHFSFSAKTFLVLFRELTGGGYWASGLIAILLVLAGLKRRPIWRTDGLLILLIIVPFSCGLVADGMFDYFIAARQFLWVLPALALITALAIEKTGRTGRGLGVILAVICLYQNLHYFSSPREDWGAAARLLIGYVKQGGCVTVAPREHLQFYRFFEPELAEAACDGTRTVLVVSPYSTAAQRASEVAELTSRGYRRQSETMIGKSEITVFGR
jgi:4-amino-4-deoxy-L-arabinose transferase-like glycosyltransferase